MREAFILYRNFFECIEQLNPTQQLETYRALANFALNDIQTDNLTGGSKIIYEMAKPTINNAQLDLGTTTKGGRPKNSDDESPVKKIKYAPDVILTESQYLKIKNKYGELLSTEAIKEMQKWLDAGKKGINKRAKNALGKNHYSYFNIDGRIIKTAQKNMYNK